MLRMDIGLGLSTLVHMNMFIVVNAISLVVKVNNCSQAVRRPLDYT